MAYDNKPTRYAFGVFDFGGAADEEFSVVGPKGKKGLLVDYGVFGVTEAMSGSTVTPKIAVGTASDPDAYGDELSLQGVALNTGKSVLSTYDPASAGYDTYMLNRSLPADTVVIVTCTGATNSPTGMGVPFVDIIWEQ